MLILKSAFLVIFLLTLFENTLKYAYVSHQATINRQQAIDIAENQFRNSGFPWTE